MHRLEPARPLDRATAVLDAWTLSFPRHDDPNGWRRTASCAALALLVAACAHGPAPNGSLRTGMYTLQVNGNPVFVPATNTLLQALRNPSTVSLLRLLTSAPAPPLYLVDGVEVTDGQRVLRTTKTCDTEGVDLLRAERAVLIYGSRAAAGAIAVRIRRAPSPNQRC